MRIRFLRRFLPALVLLALPVVASAGVYIGVSVDVPPPPLPVYVQPPCPEPGYVWMPGYWAWGPYGYYWVPGTWVLPPEVGLLWTPGYWGWEGGMYLWHAGYWGPQVGFYGGIDYGFGYDGDGFDGGYWRGGIFFYNRAVMNVGRGFGYDDYYRRPMHHRYFHHRGFDRASFNGGPHGVFARPNRMDRIAARERRFGLTGAQRRHAFMARGDRGLRARFNHGRPPIAATDRPNRFHGHNVFAARAAGRPYFRHGPGARRMDRPAWAASHRDTGPRGGGTFGLRNMNHPPLGGRRYRQHPSYHFGAAPGARYHPAPHFQVRHAPQAHYRVAPHFQVRHAPQAHYRVAPRFQVRHVPQAHYRVAPHFQVRHAPAHYRVVPHFQARPRPHFQPHPAPRYQGHAHFQPHRGRGGPRRG